MWVLLVGLVVCCCLMGSMYGLFSYNLCVLCGFGMSIMRVFVCVRVCVCVCCECVVCCVVYVSGRTAVRLSNFYIYLYRYLYVCLCLCLRLCVCVVSV